MNEATHKETNTNPENPEKTTWTLEEAETKLKEELKKFQDAGEKILDQYENIASIQKEIDETKQSIVELKTNEKTKDKYSSPQSVFKEFKNKYKIDMNKQGIKVNYIKNTHLSLVAVFTLYFMFSIDVSFLRIAYNIKGIKIFNIPISSIILTMGIIFYWFLGKSEYYKKQHSIIDRAFFLIIYVLSICFFSSAIIEYPFMCELLGDISCQSKLYLNFNMILLIIMSHIDNNIKYYSTEETKIAYSIIRGIFNNKVSVDFIKLLLKYKDDIEDDFIGEFKNSLLCKIFIAIGGFALFLSFPKIFKMTSLESLLFLCMISLLVVLLVFWNCKSFYHERGLYFKTLKDMEFKGVLEI